MNTPKLPPLPEPVVTTSAFSTDSNSRAYYTAEQMQAYALAAIEAQGVPDVVQEWKSGVISAQEAMLKIASAPPAPQADRSGCTAGTDDECKHRRCATQCPKRAQLGLSMSDGLLESQIEPRPLLYPLSDYHRAMADGPLHHTWIDKPHRLVYDLIAAVRYYASTPPAPQARTPHPAFAFRECEDSQAVKEPQASVVQQEPNHWVVPDYGFLFPSEDAAKRYLDNIGSDERPTACYTHPAQQAKPQLLSDEQDRALCEAYCNTASDEYFKARPQLDSDVNRRIFYAGHRKAWINWQAAHGIKE